VMASLARRENLAGQIQTIYMDPPYGIKFSSNFQSEVSNRNVQDREQDLTREPEMFKAYRDTWTLGVHSYLAYLRDRLTLCKELLADSGSIFIQISDENLHRIRNLMDEIFNPENFIATIAYKTSSGLKSDFLAGSKDYVIWYTKNREEAKKKFRRVFLEKIPGEEGATQFGFIQTPNGEIRSFDDHKFELETCPDAELLAHDNLTSTGSATTTNYLATYAGKTFKLPSGNVRWKTPPDGMSRLIGAERTMIVGNTLRYKRLLNDFRVYPLIDSWTDTSISGFADKKRYVVQTSPKIIERCILMTTDPGDLVFDPTCGSGTTALVAEQWGRRWLTCDSSRVALALARQRLLTSKFEYYQLNEPPIGPISGFSYKTVPHITLKSIAQNSSLDKTILKHQKILEEKLSALNETIKQLPIQLRTSLKERLSAKEKSQNRRSITDADRRRWLIPEAKWEHWEVPFDSDPDWPSPMRVALEDYRMSWRAKMDEVNICIAANAEQEELVDQPLVVKGITRVAGPFTVEAVMPPVESMSMDIESPIGGAPDEALDTFGDGINVEPQNAAAFQEQVIGLLRTGGVDFLGNKHVDFSRLDALQGSVLHAEGEWKLPDGTQRRVVVSIGPRVGNVTDFQVEKALRQANLKGYQDLLFAGFGFDGVAQAVIQENAEEMEGVQTHLFLIRPDVVMGDLLKNTAASQLFTAMGLPRTTLERLPNEEFAVHMAGVDIYDPVTNALIPTGADKVAAWFVDSDYDGRCFCITQAFFPDKSAWEKIAKALKSTVDEARMEAFSGTRSLPFKTGKHSRVAVKVIDPRGNEVMAVHRLG
jgi:adenine-specific DNA-methyltransferase